MDFPDVTKCFLYKRDQIVAQPYNNTYLTQTFVNDAVSFIEDNANNPFFLYFPFAHPHAPLFASPQFAGKSRRGKSCAILMKSTSGVDTRTRDTGTSVPLPSPIE